MISLLLLHTQMMVGLRTFRLLISRRHTSRLAVLDDKLYTFGRVSDRSLFAEVYNPIVDKWEALPQPSPKIKDNASFAALLHGMKKIVVGFKSLYNVVTKSWNIVELLHGFIGEPPITVGNTIYWFWGISLIADNQQDEAIASLEVIGKNGGILEMRTPQTILV
ncbi:hypothetical protein SO802_001549 [Lithocarpus litseifolius]|uniref:Uncharacterized protein n=1 Tax=Lithocarpus litseifolius TaxID=425828 RepID=A0AAW2DYQ2_9ROSI